MNKKLGIYGSIINGISIFAFALSMIFDFRFGSYLSSMFIALGFILMISSFCYYCKDEYKSAGYTALIFAAIYVTFILSIYFAQLTSIRLDNLNEQAIQILDYQKFGLFFNYNLLGYGIMALSTFFIGLTIEITNKLDRWLRSLLLIHGVFFISGLIIPMIGLFNSDMQGANWIGTVVLEFWCAYFIPISIFSFLHFKNK